jgi:hypothetical protein
MNGYLAVIAKLRDGTAGNLIGGSGVTTARVFPGDPQENEVLPFISVETFDNEPFDTDSGAATTDHDLVKVICYATTDNEARTIAAAARVDLDEQSGTLNGFVVENIRFLRVDSYDVHLTNRRARVHEHDYEVRIRL